MLQDSRFIPDVSENGPGLTKVFNHCFGKFGLWIFVLHAQVFPVVNRSILEHNVIRPLEWDGLSTWKILTAASIKQFS